MIAADLTAFPWNVIAKIKPRIKGLDTDLFVVSRPLMPTDPQQSVGIVPIQWGPREESMEMGGRFPGEPTLQRYDFVIQCMIKDTDQQSGPAVISALSSMVRRMLYRDDNLTVDLSSLTSSTMGSTERIQRWGVTNQRFLSNEISGNWVFVSTLEFWVETQAA
jgi:hypothetical protein